MSYAPKRQEAGMDDNQAQMDREALTIPVAMVTGQNAIENAMAGGGLETGNVYSGDAMGEEYNAVTYRDTPAYPTGMKGGGPSPDNFQPVKSSGGGMKATVPQSYSKTGG